MTYNQIEWAKQHDWYVHYIREGDGSYTAIVYDSELQYSVRFTDFKKLKEWAGY